MLGWNAEWNEKRGMAARVYGGRWETLSNAGEGAQGHIFTVRDNRERDGAIFALKRLKREIRSDRFLQEIQALKAIDHPSVMRIIDYSDGNVSVDKDYPYYFVMPNAENGNLKKRVALYKDNIDSVLSVSSCLTAAVAAAHSAGYVHRDIKPENILFSSLDHHPWLSDFGICHSIDHERLTKIGDVMGPRGFTAPELEGGRYGSVDPACDFYSLGKVIYYMISGGRVIQREVFDAEFHKLAEKGERYRLLHILLTRMIAPIESRVRDVQAIASDLDRIKDWESSAASLSLSVDVLSKINKQQQNSIDIARIKGENEKTRSRTSTIVNSTASSICEWLGAELMKVKALMSQSGNYTIAVQKATWPEERYFFADDYIGVSGVELIFRDNLSSFPVNSVIKFFVCSKSRPQITIGDDVRLVKMVDPEMSLIPFFIDFNDQQRQFQSGMHGYIRSKSAIDRAGQEFAQRMQQRGRRQVLSSEPLIANTFVGAPLNLITEFRASEWPAVVEKIQPMFSEAIGVVIDHTSSSSRSVGA